MTNVSSHSRPARIYEVARLAGVSIATVSYVLNNRGNISPETADRVRQAAETLHYRPNSQGRFLVQGISETIGVVVPGAMGHREPVPPALLTGLMAACQQAGYHLMLLTPTEPHSTQAYLIDIARSRRVDGVVLINDDESDSRLAVLLQENLPFVVYGSQTDWATWYDVDNREGAKLATQHLVDLGHRHIAHLAGPEEYIFAQQRRHGYEDVVRSHGLDSRVITGDMTIRSGYERTHELLSKPGRPTAIFASNDAMAIGTLQCASDLGIHVPRQISIIGFGNTGYSAHISPALTTIEHDLFAAGYRLAEMVLARIMGQEVANEEVRPSLRVRDSTGVPAIYRTPRTNPEEPVLKKGPAFALFSTSGRIEPDSLRQGVYLYDTRMVSMYQWRIDDEVQEPLALSSSPDSLQIRYVAQHSGATRYVLRTLKLYSDRMEDHWTWKSFGSATDWKLSLSFDADFLDIFELRGSQRHHAGNKTVLHKGSESIYQYEGLDHISRRVRVESSRPYITDEMGHWHWQFSDQEPTGHLTITASWMNPVPEVPRIALSDRMLQFPGFTLLEGDWHQVIERARTDLQMLSTDYGNGLVPMAGIPWFGTFFGRDAIITAYQVLQWVPEMARNTLHTLAAWQGRQDIPETEEEPGKMVHEIRLGEMARIGEVPFAKYYGSVDVTPLFLSLLVDTWQRTGDDGLMSELLPAAERALSWLETIQDSSGLGLLNFSPRSSRGLSVQSWKDSSDSMVFSNGQHAEPPLAVAEVQGYVYNAFRSMAHYYQTAGRLEESARLQRRAQGLKKRFHQRFWLADRHYYALAVDSQGRAVDAISSDPGQCLWSGIVPRNTVHEVAQHLLSPNLFSGWGIRTLGANEAAYDPYSYHRGSVWPHDTSLIAAGLARMGALEAAQIVAKGLMKAASRFPLSRLPELFSGEEGADIGPLPYPEACSPQAWAAGTPLYLLQILLGLEINGQQRSIRCRPDLSGSLPPLTITDIPLGSGDKFTLHFDGKKLRAINLPNQRDFRAVYKPTNTTK